MSNRVKLLRLAEWQKWYLITEVSEIKNTRFIIYVSIVIVKSTISFAFESFSNFLSNLSLSNSRALYTLLKVLIETNTRNNNALKYQQGINNCTLCIYNLFERLSTL